MVRERKISDLIKRGYSDDDLKHIYELARFHLENGELGRAEVIVNGLLTVAPDFMPAHLAKTCINLMHGNFEQAVTSAKEARRINAQDPLIGLYLVTALICLGDIVGAGTYLGEVGELIEASGRNDTNLQRYYKAQLARFKNAS